MEVTRVNEAQRSERRVDRLVRRECQGGVTLEKAHEVFSRFCERSQAAPTIASEMAIEYKIVCDILDGKIWPQARQHWVDVVLP